MAQVIMLIGKSGSGKSTSMRNFAKDELALINVNKKPLPFKGKFDSTLETLGERKRTDEQNSTV